MTTTVPAPRLPGNQADAPPPGPPPESLGLLLQAERAATRARLHMLRVEYDGVVRDALDANLDDEHDPEGPTVAYERAQLASRIDEACAYLADLDDALVRLAHGTARTCAHCAGPIGEERLAARPATAVCVACASAGPR